MIPITLQKNISIVSPSYETENHLFESCSGQYAQQDLFNDEKHTKKCLNIQRVFFLLGKRLQMFGYSVLGHMRTLFRNSFSFFY